MAITSNEGGTLYELDEVWVNESGTLYEQDTVHSNEGGTLYEIHSAYKSPKWTSFGDDYATIISTSETETTSTCVYNANYVSSGTAPNTVKCTLGLKAGQTVSVNQTIESVGTGATKVADTKIYNRNGELISSFSGFDGGNYTATENISGCYILFYLCKSRSTMTATATINITIT